MQFDTLENLSLCHQISTFCSYYWDFTYWSICSLIKTSVDFVLQQQWCKLLTIIKWVELNVFSCLLSFHIILHHIGKWCSTFFPLKVLICHSHTLYVFWQRNQEVMVVYIDVIFWWGFKSESFILSCAVPLSTGRWRRPSMEGRVTFSIITHILRKN